MIWKISTSVRKCFFRKFQTEWWHCQKSIALFQHKGDLLPNREIYLSCIICLLITNIHIIRYIKSISAHLLQWWKNFPTCCFHSFLVPIIFKSITTVNWRPMNILFIILSLNHFDSMLEQDNVPNSRDTLIKQKCLRRNLRHCSIG